VIINCAAYTAVDAAESDDGTARTVNALAVGALAEACAGTGARLVTFSTDYVFDGQKTAPYVESDFPDPLNVYGATKREGEHLALAAGGDVLIVRTSWVMSGTHPNFVSKILDLIAAGPVRVVDDQHGRPTFVDDLALATMTAVETRASGLLHLTNEGETTWFGLARQIARLAGLDENRVEPCSSEDFPRPARRPHNSLLDSERREPLGLAPLPHYLVSLEPTIDQLVTA
jgi:dTDP-4-dehydrorhamnose reductase